MKPMPDIGRSTSADDRWQALCALRRSQGLCVRCGAKWSCDHKCAQAVQLHILEEVLGLFESDDTDEPADIPVADDDTTPTQLHMLLSAAAVSGVLAQRTICFNGYLGAIPIHILLDSGSTHTFVS